MADAWTAEELSPPTGAAVVSGTAELSLGRTKEGRGVVADEGTGATGTPVPEGLGKVNPPEGALPTGRVWVKKPEDAPEGTVPLPAG